MSAPDDYRTSHMTGAQREAELERLLRLALHVIRRVDIAHGFLKLPNTENEAIGVFAAAERVGVTLRDTDALGDMVGPSQAKARARDK